MYVCLHELRILRICRYYSTLLYSLDPLVARALGGADDPGGWTLVDRHIVRNTCTRARRASHLNFGSRLGGVLGGMRVRSTWFGGIGMEYDFSTRVFVWVQFYFHH